MFRIVTEQHDLVLAQGNFDLKTKFLVLLAVDAFVNSTGVKNIALAAKQMDASENEISETLRITYHATGNKFLNCAVNAFE